MSSREAQLSNKIKLGEDVVENDLPTEAKWEVIRGIPRSAPNISPVSVPSQPR